MKTLSRGDLRIRRIALVVVDDAYPGHLTAAMDVLQIANIHVRNRVQQLIPGAARKRSSISHSVLSIDGAQVELMGKVVVEPDDSICNSTQQFDAVVVPSLVRRSWRSLSDQLESLETLYSWLREQRAAGAMFVGSYTGVLVLAEAGLLADRTATISVDLEAQFRRRYPRLKLDTTQIVVEDHDVVSAATLGSHMDALWRIVNRFRSGIIAQRTAYDLFSHESGGDPVIERAQYLMLENISAKLDPQWLASALAMSQRTFFRRFKSATGMTPNAYLQSVRIASAKSSLELTDDSIATIAACSGYTDKAFFSKVFREHTGLTPRAYRAAARREAPGARRRNTRMSL